MTVHLLKLAVGAESVDSMARWQAQRLSETGRLFHRTRNYPRRAEEVLYGGSMYWIVKGFVRVRQRITHLERASDSEGRPCCLIHLDPELVRTELQPRRPHQGWRYLDPEHAPRDARGGLAEGDDDEPPPEMAAELRELGLL